MGTRNPVLRLASSTSWPVVFLPMRMILPAIFFSLLTGCTSLLYYPVKEPFTDPTQFRHKPEVITFATEDGLKLSGWYFKSPARPAKATLVFFHGNGQNMSTHFFSLYWMLEEGYDYMIFDYRGYGDSDGKPSPEGTLKDGRAALKWIDEHKDPKTKLVVFAQSLGSAVALRTLCDQAKSRGPDYAALVVDSGFVSYRRAAQKVLSHGWLTWAFQWIGWLVMSDEFAPGTCVGDISPHPLLVVHGDADQAVDFSLGEKLFELAREPKEFWKIPGGRHIDFLYRENFRYRKPFLAWLEKALSPAPVKGSAAK